MSDESIPAAPQLSEPGPGVAPELPKTMRQAVALMYAGAVLSLLNLVIVVFAKSRIHDSWVKANNTQAAEYAKDAKKAKPLSAADLEHAVTQAWLISMISGAITVALWVVMAYTNKKGNSVARIVATVLCVLNVLLTIANLSAGFSGISFAASLVMLLVSVGATFLIWRKPSSEYYSAVRAQRS